MPSQDIVREQLPGGELRLSASGCAFTYQRVRAGVMLVTITGIDNRELFDARLAAAR